MSTLTKRDVLFFVAGGVIAGAATGIGAYFASKKSAVVYEERLAKELQESINFLVQTQFAPAGIKAMTEETVSENEAEVEDFNTDFDPDGTLVFPEPKKSPLDELAKNQQTRYDKVMTEQEYETAVLPPEPAYDNPDISVISYDIFVENGSEYEQSSLTYFADRGVLDEIGDFVDEPMSLIGEQTPPFGDMSGDPAIVYLRNKKLKREFEVISDPGNASDFVSARDDQGESLQHSLQELRDMYHPSRRR